MKKLKEKNTTSFLVGMILGIIIAAATSAGAAILYQSSQVSYSNSSSGLSSTNVQGAIDELSTKCSSSTSNQNIVYTLNYYIWSQGGVNVGQPKTQIGQTIPSNVIQYSTPAAALNVWDSDDFYSGYMNRFYLKHILTSSNRIKESYVEYTISEEDVNNYPGMIAGTYSLKGGDYGAAFEENDVIIKKSFGCSSYPERCNYPSGSGKSGAAINSGTYSTDEFDVYADSTGHVYAYEPNDMDIACDVFSDGSSGCGFSS